MGKAFKADVHSPVEKLLFSLLININLAPVVCQVISTVLLLLLLSSPLLSSTPPSPLFMMCQASC